MTGERAQKYERGHAEWNYCFWIVDFFEQQVIAGFDGLSEVFIDEANRETGEGSRAISQRCDSRTAVAHSRDANRSADAVPANAPIARPSAVQRKRYPPAATCSEVFDWG